MSDFPFESRGLSKKEFREILDSIPEFPEMEKEEVSIDRDLDRYSKDFLYEFLCTLFEIYGIKEFEYKAGEMMRFYENSI